MHAARGGWLGQTYALAKFDDSFEGKKSGIRRSKEERKGMVENFIKRYQKLNNGDFPSLNLTRKEVGGSFYTVREIVREIIQENRVLGPPKSPPGDQNLENLDSFLEDHPLGSIAVDHVHLVPPVDPQRLHEYELISEKALNTRSSSEIHQGQGHDNVVDGIMNTTEKGGEAKHSGNSELLVGKDVEKHTDDEENSYVETSQLSRGDMAETTYETVNNEALEKPEKTELVTEGDMGRQQDKKTEVVANQTQVHQLLEDIEVGNLVGNTVHNMDEKSSERESVDAESDTLLAVNGNTRAILEDTLLAEKTVNGDNVQNLYSKTACNPVQQPTIDERSAKVNKSTDQNEDSSQKRKSNTTLNRINLSESWKAASKKSYGRESHPLVKFVKSFITAFVKFWTE
uniref:uncharacterized protein LOC122585563 isoform X3 n=1 Tax=Erigeron canadensis TaxID=72917 RepID=UPI001CB990D8|nr:uncharacterized protein LOC122585563 isoform X3 [Erigeron canadensis]